ncbi:MAG TPA: hypothetical protein VL294_13275 [Pseudolysinimonas sp.]|nr:hypothetical protein [Pseudolysinimonas sp.]
MTPAIVLIVLLALLAAFQLGLALGAPWGRLAWGGQERVLSPKRRGASAAAIVIYAVVAVIELDRAGVISVLPDLVSVIAAWVVFAYLCIGVLMNLLSRSVPERAVMTPVAAVLAVLSLLVALS